MSNEINVPQGLRAPDHPVSVTSGRPDFSEVIREYKQREVNIRTSLPVIYLESVAGCPFSCAMCKPAATRAQRVSRELLRRIEPALAGLEVLAIHGQGEPLMADLDYFVDQSLQHRFVLHMDTNGMLLTDKIADLLLKTRLSIRFSVHAGKPETYYRIMGLDLNRVKDNIVNLVEKSQKSPHPPDLWFSFVVMKENFPEIEDFLRLTYKCGIRSVRFMHLWPNHDTLRGLKVRGMTFRYAEQSSRKVRHEFSRRLPHYEALASEMGIRIEWGDAGHNNSSRSRTWGELANKISHRAMNRWFFPLRPARGACAAPWIGQLTVKLNGDLLLCCSSSTILGNLYRSSLEEIWHGPQMTQIRQAFHRGFYPHQCGYCRGFGLNNYPRNSFIGVEK
jgi:MoaA/NifB/PqqE/SkfB family radical SAM enzyme